MSVTASFQPDRITAAAGDTAALSLHLQNNTDAERLVTLRAGGGLAAQTVLQTETIYLDPNEHFEVPVIVDASVSLVAGSHECVIEIVNDDVTVSAAATIDIDSTQAWTAHLEPQHSKSATAGRHKIAIENAGNVPATVELVATTAAEVTTELAAPAVNIDPGKTARVEFRVAPHSRFWNGPSVEHPFSLTVAGNDGERTQLDGVFEQGPRIRPWLLPAAAGMAGALLLGTLAWFTLLKPSVLDEAREDAAELDAAQQADLDDRVTAIEAAADEASELPLGEPADQRLTVTAETATTSTVAFNFDEGRQRAGSSRSATSSSRIRPVPSVVSSCSATTRCCSTRRWRTSADLDFPLGAPIRVESASVVSLRVTCATPGPGTEGCEASALVLGFVDDA